MEGTLPGSASKRITKVGGCCFFTCFGCPRPQKVDFLGVFQAFVDVDTVDN